jgi:hypothetical protein
MNEAAQRFHRVPSILEKAEGHGWIEPYSLDNLLHWHENLREEIETAEAWMPQRKVQVLKRQASDLTRVAFQLDDGHVNTDERIVDLCMEAAEEVCTEDRIEILIVPGTRSSPMVYPRREEESITLVILDSVDYPMEPGGYPGLLFHEVAHGQWAVYDKSWSLSAEMRRRGEALADLFGLSCGGPAFPRDLVRFKKDEGYETRRKFPEHPSFAFRGTLLHEITHSLWTGDFAEDVQGFLKPLLEALPPGENEEYRKVKRDGQNLEQSLGLDSKRGLTTPIDTTH